MPTRRKKKSKKRKRESRKKTLVPHKKSVISFPPELKRKSLRYNLQSYAGPIHWWRPLMKKLKYALQFRNQRGRDACLKGSTWVVRGNVQSNVQFVKHLVGMMDPNAFPVTENSHPHAAARSTCIEIILRKKPDIPTRLKTQPVIARSQSSDSAYSSVSVWWISNPSSCWFRLGTGSSRYSGDTVSIRDGLVLGSKFLS